MEGMLFIFFLLGKQYLATIAAKKNTGSTNIHVSRMPLIYQKVVS